MFSFSWYKGHLSHGKFISCFYLERGGHMLFLKCLLLRIISIPKWHIGAWRVLIPFSKIGRKVKERENQ